MHFDFSPSSPTFWVFVAVLIFIFALAYYGVFKKMGAALDARAKKIENELEEAKRLREEAQALLASYQRQQKEAEAQAEHIIKQAKHDAEVMAAKARTDLQERLERRAALAEAKIATAEAQAMKDVQARAVDIAIEASQDILRHDLSASEQTNLVAKGIKELRRSVN